MQEFPTQRLTARIAARNAPGYVHTRLTLRFSLLYFAMFAAGLLLCRTTPLTSLTAVQAHIRALFSAPFAGCEQARDYIRAVLKASEGEMTVMVLLALSGMTFFCTAASDVLLSLHALSFGILCGGAANAVISGQLAVPHANLAFFLYFFSQLALAGILLAAAVEAVVFSYGYRDANRALRTQRDHLAVSYLLHMLSLSGSVLLLHTARALIPVLFGAR